MARPRDIGTRAETAVVMVLRANGFPLAERRALRGPQDAGDVTGTPRLCWEIKGGESAKGASPGQIVKWLDETERERRACGAEIGVLVVQRRGVGLANAAGWTAITRAAQLGGALEVLDDEPVMLSLAGMCRVLCGLGYGQEVVA